MIPRVRAWSVANYLKGAKLGIADRPRGGIRGRATILVRADGFEPPKANRRVYSALPLSTWLCPDGGGWEGPLDLASVQLSRCCATRLVDALSGDGTNRTLACGFGSRLVAMTSSPGVALGLRCALPGSARSDWRYQRTPGCPGRAALRPSTDFALVDRWHSANGRGDAPAMLNRAVPWSRSSVR